ncbi:MAG: HEAT repeat domain-containing protein [Planctomycetota bacterium]|nr:HEAT repeat domain-containing protein [Planctomycetota bacterium]
MMREALRRENCGADILVCEMAGRDACPTIRIPLPTMVLFASLAFLPLTASGQNIIDLLDLQPKERTEAVKKFIETKAADAPLSEVIGLFDPDLDLGPDELEAIYFVVVPRMERKKLPALSSQARRMEPGVAAPALRLLGRSGNKDAFEILTGRVEDKTPEIVMAAAEGLGYLGDKKAVAPLRPLVTGLAATSAVSKKPWNPNKRQAISAALALAQLGEWGPFENALNELGLANGSRIRSTWHACRTTYNSPDQCRVSLKHVLMVKSWFRFVLPWLEELCRRHPKQFATAVGNCQQPYALDMLYGVIHRTLNKGNVSTMLPLMNGISNEIKSLYLDLGEPFFDAATKQKVLDSIRAHAQRPNDVRARLFAVKNAHWLPGEERDAMLDTMTGDENVWVRHEATARKR